METRNQGTGTDRQSDREEGRGGETAREEEEEEGGREGGGEMYQCAGKKEVSEDTGDSF